MVTKTLDVAALIPEGTHLIGGQFVRAVQGRTFAVIDPANGAAITNVARGDAQDVSAAVAAAGGALPGWKRTAPAQRGELLRAWARRCSEHLEELAVLESTEVGHPLSTGKLFCGRSAGMITYHANAADRVFGATLPNTEPGQLTFTLREPFGVCGVIVPWNVPSVMMVRDVAPALAAGNTVIVKPAEDAPLTVMLLAKLALEAGLPPGVLNVVNGFGPEAGQALAEHSGIRHMAFTGSPETGQKVMEACAKNLTPLHLELGGKSPQVVLEDADLRRVVPMVVTNAIRNTGQLCFAGTRLVVEEPLRARLVDAVRGEFEKLRVGPWYDDPDLGPLVSAKQQERVLNYLSIGTEEGARAVTGGGKSTDPALQSGFFVQPTIFDDVKPEMRIAKEEIFGPVLSVLGFRDPDEAVQIANGTSYGLIASVWTDSVHRAVRLAKELEAGQVYVNSFYPHGSAGAPFGGYKKSGFGRTGGFDAVVEYTQEKTVIIDGG